MFNFHVKCYFKKNQLKTENVGSNYCKSYGGCQITKAKVSYPKKVIQKKINCIIQQGNALTI